MSRKTQNAPSGETGLKVNPSTVQRAVRLLKLPLDTQEQVAAGKITKTLLREVQKIKGENAEALRA